MTDGGGGAGLERFRADAAARGLDVEVVPRPAARSLEEAAALLGIEPSRIVKTLVVRHPDGSYLFVLVPGGRAISWPKLRAVLGVNRVSMPDADAAFAATGFRRGTITPLGSTTPWPVYADATVAGRVSLGAGDHGHSAFVDSGALLAALEAEVADLTEPEA